MPKRGLVVMIRGPIGAGKTTLMQGLARTTTYRLWALDTDAVSSHHPGDPYGEHLEIEWPLEIDILSLHARIILGRGLNLVLDPGLFLTSKNVDRFLKGVGRSRRDRKVVMIRLMVSPRAAVRRKTTLAPAYIRASHKGWQTSAIPGEIVIDTDGLSPAQVLRVAKRALRERIPTPSR